MAVGIGRHEAGAAEVGIQRVGCVDVSFAEEGSAIFILRDFGLRQHDRGSNARQGGRTIKRREPGALDVDLRHAESFPFFPVLQVRALRMRFLDRLLQHQVLEGSSVTCFNLATRRGQTDQQYGG